MTLDPYLFEQHSSRWMAQRSPRGVRSEEVGEEGEAGGAPPSTKNLLE